MAQGDGQVNRKNSGPIHPIAILRQLGWISVNLTSSCLRTSFGLIPLFRTLADQLVLVVLSMTIDDTTFLTSTPFPLVAGSMNEAHSFAMQL